MIILNVWYERLEKYFNKYNNSEIITDYSKFFYNCKLPFEKCHIKV